jgi:hypothetical protein
MLQSNICESLWLLECGAVKQNEKLPASAASALFGWESGLSEPEIGLEHDKWQNLHGARLQKQLQ